MSASVRIEKKIIPTYPEPPAEEMPMFAENRVHQRTSGNPYPNKVVLSVIRDRKTDKEYTVIVLENDYLRIEVLPEIGGRIFSALDKTTGYDFFYRQHVIKPALIGCLGSWISGGVEFNWPFHHRPSTYMPVDYYTEETEDGVTVWMSEHDCFDRMKGTFGVFLPKDGAYFETRMKLCNRTPTRHSFLWWENAAVPVNEQYRIFFPKDVTYVNFHYKRSVTTYPIATNALGVYNGIRYNGETDISYHKNTRQPTSYFCAPTKYDFFGGYDEGKQCGVVHIGDHHISTGKKMFTWAYNQLSKSWENALTDTDGAYAELMAGSYSDNQPDFSFLEPYETKSFTQSWYPIGSMGVPDYANIHGAVHFDNGSLCLQTTKDGKAHVTILDKDGKTVLSKEVTFLAGQPQTIENAPFGEGFTFILSELSEHGKILMKYTGEKPCAYAIPETTKDIPYFKEEKSADVLYREGVHVLQYRDPSQDAEVYFTEALRRDPDHADSLTALANLCYERAEYEKAYDYAKKALGILTRFNKQPESGKVYYLTGLILEALGKDGEAYDSFRKAAWSFDCRACALTKCAEISGRRHDFEEMLTDAEEALKTNTENPVTLTLRGVALYRLGKSDEARAHLSHVLSLDRLNHFAAFVLCYIENRPVSELAEHLQGESARTVFDIVCDLSRCGMDTLALKTASACWDKSPVLYCFLGDYDNAEASVGKGSFPFLREEYAILKKALGKSPEKAGLHYLLGCFLYAKKRYEEAEEEFRKAVNLKPDFAYAYRNLACLYYSHLDRKEEVLPLLEKALSLCPESTQIVYETALVMAKLNVSPAKRIAFIESHTTEQTIRDDLSLELARAYNLCGEYDNALAILKRHTFVPCEGGEHAVAEQYMFSFHAKGRKAMENGKYEEALAYFENALTLPQNLGAGIWNEVKYVPHKFYMAKCLEHLGRHTEAAEIYNYILGLGIDYFSDMHLRELCYYKAESLVAKGDPLGARALVDKYLRIFFASLEKEDAGCFSTTPFFISYIEQPKEARRATFTYLLGLLCRFTGDDKKAKELLCESFRLDPANLWCALEKDAERSE